MSLERFFEKYPKYNGYQENQMVEKIYKWLASPKSIFAMINSCNNGRPALEAVVEKLEEEFKDQTEFPLNVQFNKQLVGAMIKEILWDFGYRQTTNIKLSNSVKSNFKSATHYEYHPEYETKQLVWEVTIKKTKDEIPFV